MDPLALVLTLIVFLFVCEMAVVIYRFQIMLAQKLKKQTYASVVGFSSIVTSALFTAVAGTLVLLTQHGDPVACEATILTCIFLYTATKFQLYLFFIERMYVVHRKPSETRVQSRLYLVNLLLLVPYVAIIIYRVSFIDDSDVCRIGLHNARALPLIVYDTIFSIYSVGVFVWPLYTNKSKLGSEKLLAVARKNAIGTFISTVSSFLNIFSLAWESELLVDNCLMFCTVDVMVNVLVMNYLISGSRKKPSSNGRFSNSQISSVDESSVSFKQKPAYSKIHPKAKPVRLVSETCLTECTTLDEVQPPENAKNSLTISCLENVEEEAYIHPL